MRRISTILIIIVFLLTGGYLWYTGGALDKGRSDSETITVVDNLDNEVTIPKKIDRIVVAGIFPFPSVLSIFLGSAEKIVGIPPVSMSAAKSGLLGEIFPEILKAETGYTNGDDLNIEELMKLNPDVVFYSSGNTEWTKMLKNAGIPGVAISPRKWDYDVLKTYDQWIALLSKIFPESDKAEQVSAYSKKVYETVQKKVAAVKPADKKKVLFLFQYDDQKMITSGKHFFGQFWCDAVGALNAAEEITVDNANAKITMEQVYKWNPDVVIITNFTPTEPQDLFNNRIAGDNWSSVKAVQDKAVYKMPLGSYRSYTPCADTPLTLLWLAKKVYPQLFTDVNVEKEVRDYYGKIYGITLTDAQIKRMFTPVAEAAAGFKK